MLPVGVLVFTDGEPSCVNRARKMERFLSQPFFVAEFWHMMTSSDDLCVR